jgi:hypothetical protein
VKKSGQYLETAAENALLSCLSMVPFLSVIESHPTPGSADIQSILNVTIQSPGGGKHLIAEVRGSGQPRLAREAVDQMLRLKRNSSGAYYLFIAPYISPKAADICLSEGVGYLDLSGNCLLSFDSVFIHKKDYPNRFKEKRDMKSLYTPKAERILRVMLCNPKKAWKIKELADAGCVSLGQAANVKKMLEDREYISGKRGGFTLRQPETLLREWAKNYDYRKNHVRQFFSLMSVMYIEKMFAAYCNKNKIKYALTGYSGAARTASVGRYNQAMIYAADIPGEAFSDLSLKAVKSGGNLLLFTPYDDGVFSGATSIENVKVASDIQQYLDLQSFRGRSEKTTELLYTKILKGVQ